MSGNPFFSRTHAGILLMGIVASRNWTFAVSLCAALPAMAEHNSPDALFAAGESAYERMDDERAVHFFRAAALAGHTEAMYRLSVCHEYGFGVERDAELAANFCRYCGKHRCTPCPE